MLPIFDRVDLSILCSHYRESENRLGSLGGPCCNAYLGIRPRPFIKSGLDHLDMLGLVQLDRRLYVHSVAGMCILCRFLYHF